MTYKLMPLTAIIFSVFCQEKTILIIMILGFS